MAMVTKIAKLSADGWYVFISMATLVYNGTLLQIYSKKVYVYAALNPDLVYFADGLQGTHPRRQEVQLVIPSL